MAATGTDVRSEELLPAQHAHDDAGPSRRLTVRRAAVIGTPAAYLVALALTIANWGLPIARDQLFFWLALGMLAFSVGRWRTWGWMLLEWAPFFGLLVLYDVLRGAVAVSPERAHQGDQIAFDRFFFGHDTPTVWLQDQLWTPAGLHWYDYAVWVVYMTHFFAVWTVAAVLWRVAHDRFRRFVAVTVLLTLGAFLTYWLYPAEPPWLAAQDGAIAPVHRIVPAVWGELGVGTVKSVYENASLVNVVAAMPSLHAAYPALLFAFFWSSGWRARVPLGLYTLGMGTVLVYGGEHYVLDIVAGWAMVGVVFGVVALATRLWVRRAERVPARATPPTV
ncbi:hypothetical protein DSM112329_02477 [Paraconexibacter sp. AEG42_29]|uniref:Inositolphosphotransferase Aur1/Ipt1 domain-containing protein n=1 Tax=Paraconexibacter sp. AEG42_29 TaxID=2997339 RepID=A0AAU7AVE8_9ACTN